MFCLVKPHISGRLVLLLCLTLIFPVCSCMMKLKRCWINHHNLFRWPPRSPDTSVRFLNTSPPILPYGTERHASVNMSGGGEASAYRNTETSPWTPGEPERSHGANTRASLNQTLFTVREPDARFTALVFVHIHAIPIFQKITTKNWKNSGLPELKERAKHWLLLYYLFCSFLLYVCVWIFYDLQTIRIQCFGEKNVICDIWALSVTYLSLEI